MNTFAIIIVVLLFLMLAAGTAYFFVRRTKPVPASTLIVRDEDVEDPAARAVRHRALNERGNELLERRAELESRRGALAGNTEILAAFEELEKRRRGGQISDDEFEREKIRLLSG